MIERFFSTPQRHRTYAIALAIGLALYLVVGFVAVKWIFLGESHVPSFGTCVLILVAPVIFASVHIASMKQLDRVSPRARD